MREAIRHKQRKAFTLDGAYPIKIEIAAVQLGGLGMKGIRAFECQLLCCDLACLFERDSLLLLASSVAVSSRPRWIMGKEILFHANRIANAQTPLRSA